MFDCSCIWWLDCICSDFCSGFGLVVLFVVISVLGIIYISNKNGEKSILPKQKNHLKIDNTEENKIDQSINKTLSLTKQNDLKKTTEEQIVEVISDTDTNTTDTVNIKEDEIIFNHKPLNDTLLKNNTLKTL